MPREILGGHFKIGTSGGGGLAPRLDRFFNSIGIRVVEVYGLTETAPFCCIRNYRHPVLGTIGKMLPFCEGRVLDKNGMECKAGQLGVLYVKGPNVMKGYYNRPELTAEVLQDGWFNTGDLVIKSYRGEIVVKGRQKDTIVLRSGENVEPFPIECKLEESEYIAKAVVVGQDKNALGALIVPAKDAIKEYAEHIGLETSNMTSVLKAEQIRALIFKEMERLITVRNGFKPFEKVGKFVFLDKQFEVGVELSAKGGIMRQKIEELYKWQIIMLFSGNAVVQNLSAMIPPNLPNIGTIISTNIPNLESIKSKLQSGKKDE
ncbi:MAG: AMP-binding protein [Treponema sp.]